MIEELYFSATLHKPFSLDFNRILTIYLTVNHDEISIFMFVNFSGPGTGVSGMQAVELRRVRTLYACVGEHETELSFEPNQIISNGKHFLLWKNHMFC